MTRATSLKVLLVTSLVSPIPSAWPEDRSPAVLPKRVSSLDPNQTNSVIFQEVSKANLAADKKNWGKLVIIKWANREYERSKQSGQTLDPNTFRSQINSMIAKYNNEAKLLEDPNGVSTRGFDYANLGVKMVGTVLSEGAANAKVPGLPLEHPLAKPIGSASKIGVAAGELAIEVARDWYADAVGPREQAKAQDSLSTAVFQADQELSLAYANGMEDASFRETFNSTLALDTRTYIGASATDNLSLNLEHARGYLSEAAYDKIKETHSLATDTYKLLQENIRDGRLTVDQADLDQIAGSLSTRLIDEIKENTQSIKNHIDGIEAKKLATSVETELSQIKYQTAQSTFFLIAGLTSLHDSQKARVVQAAGTAIVQIASHVETFQHQVSLVNAAKGLNASKVDLPGHLVGTLNLAAGIGAAVQGLLSVFMPSMDQIILEQILKLGEQIRTLERNMHSRFDEVDRRIGSMFASMNLGFAEVGRMLQGIQYNQHEMKSAITGIETSLTMLNQQVYRNLKDGFHERVQEDTNACLNFAGFKTSDWYLSCLGKFVTYSTHHAGNSLASGYADALVNATSNRADGGRDALNLLNQELNKGLWNNINLIGGFLRWQYGDASLLGSEGNPLVNLEEWNRYANDFAIFVSNQPEFVRLHAAQIANAGHQITAKGADLSAALNRLAQRKTQAAPPPDGSTPPAPQNLSTLRRVLQDYEGHVSNLKAKLDDDFERFVANANNFDPTVNIDQLPVQRVKIELYGRTAIGGCENYRVPHTDFAPEKKIMDPEFQLAIPREFKIAEALGLGAIRYCYDNVGWADVREEMHLQLSQGLYKALTAFNPLVARRNPHADFLQSALREELRLDPLDAGRYFIPLDKYEALKERAAAIQLDLDAFLKPTGSRTYGKISLQIHMTFEGRDGQTILFSSRHPIHTSYATRHHNLYALSKDDRGEMERRFGGDTAKWPMRNGLWQLWAADNGFGLSKDQRGENADSLELSELEAQWGELMARFSASTELLTAEEVEKSCQAIREKIAKRLSDLRAAYVGQTLSDLGNAGTLKTQLSAVNGSLNLVSSLLTLTYPESTSKDDSLHATLFGQDALVAEGSILTAYESNDTFRASLAKMFDKNTENLQKLYATIDRLETYRPGGEPQPDIHKTMSRMEVLEMGASIGGTSINEAVEAIKKQLAASLEEERSK